MALGAYAASTCTLFFLTNDSMFGDALLPVAIGPWLYPLALIIGGLVAAAGALVVAIPSFRTRGDYLAIISLAFMFMVKSLVENLEWVGGPRGMGGQPYWSTLPVVFAWMVVCIWVINNFVRSIYGKALNAVRDNEMAADAMTVNTRKTKMWPSCWGPSGPAWPAGSTPMSCVSSIPTPSASSGLRRFWPWSTSAGSTRWWAPSWAP